MARIVVSFSGEGRGHAARVLCLIQELRGHRLLVLCPGNMWSWMRESTSGEPHVELQVIPSLHFAYYASGKLSYVKSCCSAVPFLYQLPQYLRDLTYRVAQFDPHLAIVDFEPLLPRITRPLKIATLSLDHQHFLAAMDLSELLLRLRLRAEFLRPSVKLFCPSADAHLVSSFYQFPAAQRATDYRQVGVLVREELGFQPSQVGDHLLVYLRRRHAGPWIEKLAQLGEPCLVYGLDRSERMGSLWFKQISSSEFIRDLVSCRCLISTAGNQLIGEALAVGKPVLAIPEQGNFEQQINGHFLQASGLGQCLMPGRVSAREFQSFIDLLPAFRERMSHRVRPGNSEVRQQIDRMIPLGASVTRYEEEKNGVGFTVAGINP